MRVRLAVKYMETKHNIRKQRITVYLPARLPECEILGAVAVHRKQDVHVCQAMLDHGRKLCNLVKLDLSAIL